MQRILIMAARMLGPMLIAKLLRGRKRKKRSLPDQHDAHDQFENQHDQTIEH